MRFITRLFLFTFLLLTLYNPSYGQKRNYGYTQITINEGLAHNSTEYIFKDSEGFVWIGTEYGLNQLSGYNIKTFRKFFPDSNSISSNSITAISEDSEGFIWVGTNNGLNRYDKKTGAFKNYFTNDNYESLPGNQILTLKFIQDKIWVGTNDGLALYNKEKDSFVRIIPKRSDTTFNSLSIYDIIETRNGDIYISSENSCIHKLDVENKQFTPVYYKRSALLAGNYRKHIAEDLNGDLWISAFTHGIARYSPSSGKSEIYTAENSGLATNLLNGRLVYTSENKLWITTDGEGIIVFDIENKTFQGIQNYIENDDIILNSKIYFILIDNEGIVWLGSYNSGITVLNPNSQKFSVLKASKELNTSLRGISILSVFEDSKGRIWIGSDGSGLYQLTKDGMLKQHLYSSTNSNSISANRIVCIEEDQKGNILLGSYTGGFIVYNPEKDKFTRYLPNNNTNTISSPHIWAIYPQSEQKIWLGLLANGLDLFNPISQKFISYGPFSNQPNRVNHSNINCIIEDTDGDIWFGTEGLGVNILNKESNKISYSLPEPNQKQLIEREVRSMYQDSKGTIWLATDDGGLYSYNKTTKSLQHFPLSQNLQSNIVVSIIEDNNENLWLGMGNGILKFNINTFEATHYDKNDGIMGNMCNSNAICKLSSGDILIGTTNGLSSFHPDSITTISHTPKAFLSQLRIQNKVISANQSMNGRVVINRNITYTQNLTLKPKDKTFTIEFGTNNFTLPNRSKFKYKLEGFEDEWITTDANRRFATYTNLDPGKYTLMVTASNSDLAWSDEITTLNITVLPPFWRTIWFKAIMFFGLALIIYAVYRYLLNKREKQFRSEKMVDEQKIILLEKEKLETELNNQTFNIINRNKSLIAIRRRLSLLSKRLDKKSEESVKDIIEYINKEVNEEKDWKHIEPRLDKVYNNFMTTLKSKHADLTISELRIAAYVRMGLSTKEISEIMQKTTKAVENDRYRLRRKLEIQTSSSLKNYLLDL